MRHPRRRPAAEAESRARAPTSIFHLAAYKHVDWAEALPGGVRRHEPAGQLERAARRRGGRRRAPSSSPRPTRRRWPRASTGARSASWSSSTALRGAASGGGQRCAVRLVNVLGSAGSASELFLRQARAGVPLTVTDTGMMRYWITMAHAALVLAHGALLAAEGEVLATPHDPAELSVGELAERIWRAAGAGEERRHRAARHPPRRDAERGADRARRAARRRAHQGIAAIAGGAARAGPGLGRRAARGGDEPRGRRAPSGSRRCAGRACSSPLAEPGIRTRRTAVVEVTAPRRARGAW